MPSLDLRYLLLVLNRGIHYTLRSWNKIFLSDRLLLEFANSHPSIDAILILFCDNNLLYLFIFWQLGVYSIGYVVFSQRLSHHGRLHGDHIALVSTRSWALKSLVESAAWVTGTWVVYFHGASQPIAWLFSWALICWGLYRPWILNVESLDWIVICNYSKLVVNFHVASIISLVFLWVHISLLGWGILWTCTITSMPLRCLSNFLIFLLWILFCFLQRCVGWAFLWFNLLAYWFNLVY